MPSIPNGPFSNEYTIEVKLDPSTMTLIGHEEVLFRNLSSTPVEEIPFHLYPNAWANTGTRWVRDGRDENEILKRGADNGGYMKITGVHDQKGTDLGKSTVIKETVMRIRLAEPLLKGGEVSFVIDWETRLPHIVARMGKYGQQVNAMQWFPKLAAHVDGQFVDWEFRNPSEFFANFGKYTVSITLPEKYKMGATGTLTEEPVTEGGLRTSTYEASAVHDFAWCANPNFIIHRDRTSTGTEIVLLSQPFMEPKAQLVLDATRFTIEKYAEWFFPYPYPKIVIDAEPHGSRGGMEYPMLFTISAGQPEFLSWIRERSEDPAGVTIHEFNHQYWYGLLASNEFEEAWLDEGFTTYMTYKTMDEFFRGSGGGSRPAHPGHQQGLPATPRTRFIAGDSRGVEAKPLHRPLPGRPRDIPGFLHPSDSADGILQQSLLRAKVVVRPVRRSVASSHRFLGGLWSQRRQRLPVNRLLQTGTHAANSGGSDWLGSNAKTPRHVDPPLCLQAPHFGGLHCGSERGTRWTLS